MSQNNNLLKFFTLKYIMQIFGTDFDGYDKLRIDFCVIRLKLTERRKNSSSPFNL